MIFKIYIGVSVVAFLLSTFMAEGVMHKRKDIFKRNIFEIIFSNLQVLIMCFIPIYNVFILLGFVFCSNKINESIAKQIEKYDKDNRVK